MQFLIFINFAAALQGVFLTYLMIARKRTEDTKSVVLGLLTLVLSISILGGIYGITGYHRKWPHLVNVADPLFLLYGLLLFTYIFVLPKNRLPKNVFLHGIPFVAYIIAFLTFVSGYLFSYNFNLSNNIIVIFVAVLIYSLAYSAWNKKNTIDSSSQAKLKTVNTIFNDTEKTKGRSSYVLNDGQFNEFSNSLKKAMDLEKVFTENDLSLTAFSEKKRIRPYQLSELISRVYGESFFDLMNRYRIEEIKSRLEDPASDSCSLLGIAMDCGFNSKSSFNTAFKIFTGLIGSEYRKQMPIASGV